MAVLISIHDVMPETLARVSEQLRMLAGRGLGPVTLLVVPGRHWASADLAQLKTWHGDGHELAGHGWSHRARHVKGLRHHLHSLLLSHGCAEHLALEAGTIVDLMSRCRKWFGDNGLPLPGLYVPPAWAPGPIPWRRLTETGFTHIETLRGFYDIARGRWQYAALTGYEARSRWQAPVLKFSNACNRVVARRLPLRVALHPDDHRLRLRRDLARQLDRLASPATHS